MKIHDTSDVQSRQIGEDTVIWQYTVVLPGASIGKNCNINSHCFIENDVKIGDNVTVKCGVYVWDGITMEDNVQIGPNVTFTNDLYPRAKQAFKIARTRIKYGASIGANATIIGGITIGKYAMIGAGSVVTKNVPDHTLWYGNPARQKAFVCHCGNILDKKLKCKNCNSAYKANGKTISKIKDKNKN
jgi:UDP-2-acetamido-3-amino-2,3-dideoxy-glucuronate N-acetyltransferase